MGEKLTAALRSAAQQLRQANGAAGPDHRGFRPLAETAVDLLIGAMFPRHAPDVLAGEEALTRAAAALTDCLRQVLPRQREPEEILCALLERLPEVRRQLGTDLEAAYAGDPAAHSLDEIILCYPAFTAISTYRLAHVLYQLGVPLLPRVMTEYAHRLTGIDIHPGAEIGDYFFIDHGTGVVIGETTTIGCGVKLYQHVTLGARSFDVGEDGALV